MGHRFDGATYSEVHDQKRLTTQYERVWALMAKGEWLTLHELEKATGDPTASISAQLRHMRKERFGGHTIKRRPRGDRSKGLYEYKLIQNRDLQYNVVISRDSDGFIEKSMGPMSFRRAEKVADGAGINLDWENYTVRIEENE